MAKRVFISFSFVNERGLLNDLLQFFQPYGGPVQATPTYMTENLASRGEDFIADRIRAQMAGCAALIVLVGDEVHNSEWIQYEGGVANELHIPKFGMRHPSKTGGFPNAHKGMRELPWDPDALAREIDDLP